MWHVWWRAEVHTGFGGRPEGKRPLGRLKHTWKDVVKWVIYLGWEGVD
jgi:hypothetical protein